MRLAVIALVIIVMASAIAMAFNYAHQPSYAAPSHAKRNQDANGSRVYFLCHLYARARRARRRRRALADGRTMVAGAGDGAASYGVIANRSPNSAH